MGRGWRVGIAAAALAAAGGALALRRHRASPAWRIEHGSPEERAWAIREIGKGGLSDGRAASVGRSLGDESPLVRCAALEALARGRTEGALPGVIALAASDPAMEVRLKAVEALGEWRGPEARAAADRFLGAREPEVRAAAARAFARAAGRDGAERVKRLLEDPVASVRESAREALASVAWKPAPGGEARLAPGQRSICFEAERGVWLHGNFEIAPFEGGADAEHGTPVEGKGRWLRNAEGAGGNHDWLGGENGSIDIGRVEYPVIVPAPGRWVLWARAWWMDKCGDSFFFRLGRGDRRGMPVGEDGHHEGRYRRWVWERSEPFEIRRAGAHRLEIEAREDGIRIDRMALLPAGERPAADRASDFDPLAAAPDGASLWVSRDSEVAGSSGEVRGSVFVERLGPAPLEGTLAISAEDCRVEPGAQTPLFLDGEDRVREVPFRVTFPPDAPCRERVLRAALGAGEAVVIVEKPWPWEIAGPFRPRGEGEEREAEIPPEAWRRFPPEAICNSHKTIDLERAFGNGASGAARLRCRFEALEDFEGLLLLNADDQARVWIDGEVAVEETRSAPAEGFLARRRLPVSKGIHRAEALVRQQEFEDGHIYFDTQNQWLFRLRLRRDDHLPAPVRGLPWDGP